MAPEKALDDLENGQSPTSHLINDVVQSFSWKELDVVVKDRKTKKPLSILSNSNGIVHAGEMLAIMGPSGSGKTTLLNALAHRVATAGAKTTGHILVNHQTPGLEKLRDLSTYVEQEDALIGSLTVFETIDFAARMAISGISNIRLSSAFGMLGQRDTIVGTPIKKGLSGGQKKRLGVASRLVTEPKIVFLDEPTSGLDSSLSLEVISFLKMIARKNNLLVIASIHQPSTTTFNLFDKLCLLSKGKTCYFGDLSMARTYFSNVGCVMPTEINPAEFYLDLINTDIATEGDETYQRLERIVGAWGQSVEQKALEKQLLQDPSHADVAMTQLSTIKIERPSAWSTAVVLLNRGWIKAYRDFVAYGIRLVMYLGLAILMGTVFLRLETTQSHIQPFINAIFFGGAFMSFMAVAYVPAFLEDRATFAKERANGLVGPLAFTISNFLIGLPFLFLITVAFSVVTYWLSNFRPSGTGFWMWVLWLFLDLVAAESLVVLVSSLLPVFVVALAITAFANGLWMCVDGFLVPMNILNPFWKYVFHYIDYQAYVFQGMMVNEFKHRTYSCEQNPDGTFYCSYKSSLNSEGKIEGTAVLQAFNIASDKMGEWIGIMIAIITGYRVLGYIVLQLRKD
ncbi:hypothetical protein LTR34_011123 [Exophiala xenobiotica]|nr:hypothetical protein LTR34_011123 [Exophiala xenobiotica]KAK5528531.1 hypothetical protein LTR23_010987 [Chaetothyriales sp. CCFEE 6169]